MSGVGPQWPVMAGNTPSGMRLVGLQVPAGGQFLFDSGDDLIDGD